MTKLIGSIETCLEDIGLDIQDRHFQKEFGYPVKFWLLGSFQRFERQAMDFEGLANATPPYRLPIG